MGYRVQRVGASSSSSLRFRSSPVFPRPKPPMLPSLATTRWHGTMMGSLFLAMDYPAALGALALPARAATHP